MLLLTFLLLFAMNTIATEGESDEEVPVFPMSHRSRCPTKVPSNRVLFGSHTALYHEATYFVLKEDDNSEYLTGFCAGHMFIIGIFDWFKSGKMNKCSGVLFNPFLILTSAHCLEFAQINGSTAYAGVNDMQNVESGLSRKVKDFILNPAYYLLNGDAYDMAIVEVEPAYELAKGKLTTIGFPSSESNVFTSSRWTECQIAGSGQSFTEGGKCHDTLMRLYMSGILIPLGCCNDAVSRLGKPLGQKFPSGTICLRNNSDAACAGDSGSGVICKYKSTGRKVLVGILRAGPQCCDLSDNKLNDPIERNIIPLEYWRRRWITLVTNNHFKYGSLTDERRPAKSRKGL